MKNFCFKKICIIFLSLFLIIFCSNIYNVTFAATSSSSNSTSSVGYTITNYSINMTVNENNTFNIVENIKVNFITPKHGIYRDIPLRNEIRRADGTKSSNKAIISNLKVNKPYSVSSSASSSVIKIGDADRTLTGDQEYIITYTYDIGEDPVKNSDELYFNLIGTEWDTTIDNVDFSITMPKEFDKSTLGFTTGALGSSTVANISPSVDGNTISGSFSESLKPGQALTVRLTLPEGYFVGARSNNDTWANVYSICVIVIGLIFLLIADRLWAKYGKDDKVIDTVEFYPPEGYNSAEVAYLYNGTPSNEGAISLLVYLADKGYLKIEEKEPSKGLFSKSKNYVITKLKDYDGNHECEKIFFNGLFKDSRTSVTEGDLYNDFYKYIYKINENLKSVKDRIFEKTSGKKSIWIILMLFILIILTLVVPTVRERRSYLCSSFTISFDVCCFRLCCNNFCIQPYIKVGFFK